MPRGDANLSIELKLNWCEVGTSFEDGNIPRLRALRSATIHFCVASCYGCCAKVIMADFTLLKEFLDFKKTQQGSCSESVSPAPTADASGHAEPERNAPTEGSDAPEVDSEDAGDDSQKFTAADFLSRSKKSSGTLHLRIFM